MNKYILYYRLIMTLFDQNDTFSAFSKPRVCQKKFPSSFRVRDSLAQPYLFSNPFLNVVFYDNTLLQLLSL